MATDTLDLTSLGPLLEEEVNTIVRRIGLGIMVRNIRSSPVDTGRFRSNFTVGFGSPSSSTNQPIVTSGQAQTDAFVDISAFRIQTNSTIHLNNNLPYAEKIALGSSTQAPAGWIDTNIRSELKALESSL